VRRSESVSISRRHDFASSIHPFSLDLTKAGFESRFDSLIVARFAGKEEREKD